MRNSIFILLILLVSTSSVFCQVEKDSLADSQIYPPSFYEGLTANESWEIHKAAYIKQLKTKGLTEEEFKKSLIDYENKKEEFLIRVKEQHRIAEIQRDKAEEQRKLAAIERKKADELRKQADIERAKADEQRKLAEIQREKADEQRKKDAILRKQADELRKQADIERAKADEQRKLAEIQREKADEQRKKDAILRKQADELRKQADIERAKADEQRKLAEVQRAKADELRKQAEIQRAKAEEQRKKSQEWRESTENILIKSITLSNQINGSEPIIFKVTHKTTLYIGIRAHINLGTALIEIYNPKGVKEGELSLNSKSGSNESKKVLEYTSGALDKTISNAEIGEWQIKISSQKPNGNIAMSVVQSIKPTVDE